MSFFFDVWTPNGFILASDVKISNDPESKYMHKIIEAPHTCKTSCAIVICGDYPQACAQFFMEACCLADDSLKKIAEHFGTRWTKKYAGTTDYSAVHICGFKEVDGIKIPQMWYWTNWNHSKNDYKEEKDLLSNLTTFENEFPDNNWMPVLAKRVEGNVGDESAIVNAYLQRHSLFFTWNGDEKYWKSALATANAVPALLETQLKGLPIRAAADLTASALRFLIKVGNYLENNTVSASPNNEIDVLILGKDSMSWFERAKLS